MTKRVYKRMDDAPEFDDTRPEQAEIEPVAPDEVLTVTAEPSDGEQQPDENPPANANATDLVTVKYIGPNCAVLGGAMILHDETRANVKRSALTLAEKAHPGEFQIIEG